MSNILICCLGNGLYVIHTYIIAKQIGCFNHRVVTLVADKLKKQWVCIMCIADCIRQLERKLPRLPCNQDLAVKVTLNMYKGSHLLAHNNNYDFADRVTTEHHQFLSHF